MFLAAIALLVVVQVGMVFLSGTAWLIGLWLTVFFIGFNILEATQPSLISRIAPPDVKGAAMGLYTTVQSIGLLMGGMLGGALAHWGGAPALHVASGFLALLWLLIAATMTVPAVRRPAH